jgi:hypothetical protein
VEYDMLIVALQLDPDSLVTPEKLTVVGTLAGIIWAIMTQRLVPGQFYEDLKRENEQLRHALEQWRETGRVIAGTAHELASQQPPANTEPLKENSNH